MEIFAWAWQIISLQMINDMMRQQKILWLKSASRYLLAVTRTSENGWQSRVGYWIMYTIYEPVSYTRPQSFRF